MKWNTNFLDEIIENGYAAMATYSNNNANPSINILRKTVEVLDLNVRQLLVSTSGNSNVRCAF